MSSLRTEKFDYEVKDFVPTIRKNPKSRRFKIVCGFVAAFLAVILGVFLYKSLFYREKVDAKEAVNKAFTDFSDHIFGRDSYISNNAELGKWFDYVENNSFQLDTNLKIKNVGDLPIDNIEMIKGIGIKTNSFVNKKEAKFKGEMSVSWTLFSIPLIQYMLDSKDIYVGSEEFFKESLLIQPEKYGFFSTPLEELITKYIQTELPETPINNMSVKDIVEEVKPSLDYKEIEGTKKLKAYGREVTGYGYEITAKVKAYDEPVTITIYVDKDYRLLNFNMTLNDEKQDIHFELNADFTGEKHPSDKIRVSVKLEVLDKVAEGELTFTNKVSKAVSSTDISGYLNIPGIDYTFDQSIKYNMADNSFKLEGEYSDGVDVLKITSGGEVANNEEDASLKVSFDKLTVTYSDKLVATVNLSFKISEVSSDFSGINKPDGKIIDIFNMSEDEKDSLKNQVNKRIDYYKKLLNEMMGY